ncbi:phage integrase SAM-like domain-containing protein, partial [Listeria monocytogenes]|uniref:phage integrase SAM-like domain-containing protein n=1 Tax=Listeria monocytogenes TaxID=1639 RepID=UPI002FDC6F35
NLDFHKDFTAFMISNDKAPNTIASAIKRLKNVMGQAIDAGLTSNQAFRSARFASKESDVDSIYLSELDVEKIENVAITSPMQ